MKIAYSECEPGCILEHKAGGWKTVSGILSGLLGVFDRNYDGWGWHLSIAYTKGLNGWWILEATGEGVELNYYNNAYLFADTRVYKWFDTPPNHDKLSVFALEYIGLPYDRAVYFWTGIAIIIRRLFRRIIPRLIDNQFTCWELASEFTEAMDKPILSKYNTVIISDMIKRLEV